MNNSWLGHIEEVSKISNFENMKLEMRNLNFKPKVFVPPLTNQGLLFEPMPCGRCFLVLQNFWFWKRQTGPKFSFLWILFVRSGLNAQIWAEKNSERSKSKSSSAFLETDKLFSHDNIPCIVRSFTICRLVSPEWIRSDNVQRIFNSQFRRQSYLLRSLKCVANHLVLENWIQFL